MRIWSGILVTCFCLSLTSCENYGIVARVGNKPIYVKEFKQDFLAENTINQGDNISLERKQAFLDNMIEKRLRLFDAFTNRCDTLSKVLEIVDKGEKRYIYEQVLQEKVVDKVILKKDYQERYYRVSNQIRARQIYIPFPVGNREVMKTQVYEKLDSLRQLINRGEDFDILARQFSRDSLSAGKGGDLGFLQWDDKKAQDKFLNAIFNMKNNHSTQIVETDRGLHLVQITQVRPVPTASLEQLKPEFLKVFYTEKATELTKNYGIFVEEVEKQSNVHWYEKNIDSLITLIRAEIDSAHARGEEFDAVKINSSMNRDILLMENIKSSYNSGNYVDDVNKSYPMFFPGIYSPERIRNDIKRFVDRDLITQYGYLHNYQYKPIIREKVKRLKQEQMIQNLNKIKIDKMLTDEECSKYYEQNKDKYNKPAMYKIQQIVVQDSVLAETIYQTIKKGKALETLVAKYNMHTETKKKNGVLGFFTEKQYGNIGLTAATMKVGDISKPVKTDNGFSVFKLLEIVEKENKAYSELGQRQIKAIKASLTKEKTDAWMEELRSRYPVIKNETILNRLFNEKNI
ncbi:MAG TPA: peptidylprolyl isomerase [bacterium]|nr:peptidylprolyl isomerase [bacterium]HPN42580.1 peptidylprolyl isomerase [bacterium]